MSNEVMIRETPGELSVDDVKNQVAKVHDLMKSLMHEGEHYGKIPGTDKPTLLKAGAEKLNFTFRLTPEFAITRADLPAGHREYEIVCTLRHMASGAVVAQGVGSCSTMESKYRYRKEYAESEAGPIPAGYWDLPKEGKAREKLLSDTYGAGRYRAKKVDGSWRVLKIEGDGGRIENPDIADVYNTVLKMAKKRALVDATITACAASDIFTQDVEDFADAETVTAEVVEESREKPASKPTEKKAAKSSVGVPEENKKEYMKILARVKQLTESGVIDAYAAKNLQLGMNERVSDVEKLRTYAKEQNIYPEESPDEFEDIPF